MENLENILTKLYSDLDNKGIFIPLCVSNAIIAHKLAHKDEVYWMNFSRKVNERNIETIKDIYMFYIDFLPQIDVFEITFLKQIEHLKQFHIFLEEVLYKQKYFYKNIDAFEKNISKGIEKMPNPFILGFAKEVFIIAGKIKFEQ
jgi:N-glycosylase/DNA lyase